MTLDELRHRIEPEKAALRAKGVSALYVFGSVARGEAGAASDIDLFIDLEPCAAFDLFDLVGLREDLSQRLGASADLTTRNGLHYWIRDEVLAEAVRLF